MGVIGTNSAERKDFVAQIFRCALYSLFFCVVSVLLLALIVKLFEIGEGALPIINQILKCISVFVGCFMAARPEKGFLKGILGGFVFVLLSTALFSILGGKFAWGQFGIDVLCALILGGVGGAVGAAKKSR